MLTSILTKPVSEAEGKLPGSFQFYQMHVEILVVIWLYIDYGVFSNDRYKTYGKDL